MSKCRTLGAVQASSLVIALMMAVGGVSAAHAADAETAANAAEDDAGGGLAEIVVTAQKRKENLQETPISISVLSSEALTSRHVTSMVDLGDGSIPSLKVAPFFSRASALIVNIRGIGVLSDGNQPARDQGVGVYVDGVYMGRAQGLGTALFDIENVEVLKGPQGTLFGRNTEGGAVNITTKKPTGEFHLNSTAGMGNFGSYKGEVHLDLPEFSNISLKFDGVIAHRDPIVKNPLEGASGFNQYDKRGFHAEALWKPVDGFSVDYSFDISKDESTSLYLNLLSPVNPVDGTRQSNIQAAASQYQPNRVGTSLIGVPNQPAVGEVEGHRLTVEWQAADHLTLKSISAYRRLTQSQYDNGSGTTTMSNSSGNFTNVAFSRYSLAQFRQNQISQEFQAIGDIGRLKYVAGAMFFEERVEDNAQAFNTLTFTNATGSAYTVNSLVNFNAIPIDRASWVKSDSIGVFGQATYTPALLDDAIHITGGLRWTRDTKHGNLFIVNNAAPIDRNGVSGPIHLDAGWSRVDPMVNVAADLSRDIHVYGKWSTGYKSGGANSRAQNYDAFNPETVSIFEIGAKTEFLDRHARFNIAAYAGKYKNIQVDFQRPYENGTGVPSTRTTTSTINAPGTGGLHGVEAELTVIPTTGLTLSASYSYQYVRIPATVNPYPQCSGSPLVCATVPYAIPIYQSYTPPHSVSGSIDYELPLEGFTIRAHLDGNFEKGFYGNFTDPSYKGAGNPTNVYQPKGDDGFVVNGRLAIGDVTVGGGSDAKLTFAIWSRNLFNEQHVFYKSFNAASGLQGFFNEPRTFGGEVNFRF